EDAIKVGKFCCPYEQHKLSKNDVKEILQEYHDIIGDLEGHDNLLVVG
ncbi:hypothetical protein AALP_AA5G070500, partial [Arabis alpina]